MIIQDEVERGKAFFLVQAWPQSALIQTCGKYSLSIVNSGTQIALYLCTFFISEISYAFMFSSHKITFKVKFTQNSL